MTPPQSTVTPSNTAPVTQVPEAAEELELLELDLLDEELLDELALLDELLEDELLDLLDEEALDLLLDALLACELLLEEALPLGTEHSLTPPATRVPLPKVASLQTKLPLSV